MLADVLCRAFENHISVEYHDEFCNCSDTLVGHEEPEDILKDNFIKPLKLPQLYQGEFYDSPQSVSFYRDSVRYLLIVCQINNTW